jgi:hypothetical protein
LTPKIPPMNPGRRVLRLYLAVFLHAHSSPAKSIDSTMNDILERLAHTHTLGRYVAPRWNLERNMHWRQMVSHLLSRQRSNNATSSHPRFRLLLLDWTRWQTHWLGEDFRTGSRGYLGRFVQAICEFISRSDRSFAICRPCRLQGAFS